MKRLTASCIAGLLMTSGLIAWAQDEEPSQDAAPDAQAFDNRYAILSQNNIFVRDRRPAPPQGTDAPTTQRAPTAPPVPEKDWLLIGVVFEDGQFRAYFENLKGQPTTRAVVGDPIATGFIDQVFLDAVAYQVSGQTLWVDIGEDLTGAAPSIAASSASTDETPTTQEASTAEPNDAPAGENADPSTLTLEEVMRRRRQQEGGER